MTNKEALKAWEKLYAEIDKENWLFVGTINPEMVSLAIKALEIVDDVNRKVYRNENCPQKHRCYDYQGYHCAGCSWEKKGGTENEI